MLYHQVVKPVQRPVRGMAFSTVLQVPSSKKSRLLNEIARIEPKLAKATGYSVKLTEKSGIQIVKLFNRVVTPDRCNWDGCSVCMNKESNKSSKCRVTNVVYEAVCLQCPDKVGSEKNFF